MPRYAEHKQRILEELIAARDFTVFPDALRFAHALAAKGIPSRSCVVVEERQRR